MSDDTSASPDTTGQDPPQHSGDAVDAGTSGRLRNFGVGLVVVSVALIVLAFVLENAVG